LLDVPAIVLVCLATAPVKCSSFGNIQRWREREEKWNGLVCEKLLLRVLSILERKMGEKLGYLGCND